MKFTILIETSNEEIKRCIIAAWQARFGNDDKISVKDVKDFAIGDEVIKTDIDNIFRGSSIGQLMQNGNIIMIRTE